MDEKVYPATDSSESFGYGDIIGLAKNKQRRSSSNRGLRARWRRYYSRKKKLEIEFLNLKREQVVHEQKRLC